MSNGKTQTSLAEINITPLVDVVLVLLVIFMITEPVLQSGIEVNVPKTRTVKEITQQRMVVTIDRRPAGQYSRSSDQAARGSPRCSAPGYLSAQRSERVVWELCQRDGRGEAIGNYECVDCDAAGGDEGE
jgi:biopolymer transport protein ExbD